VINAVGILMAAAYFGIPLWIAAQGARIHRTARHRLVGDGLPHCSKCDYILSGIGGDICPECGTPREPNGVSYTPLEVRRRLQRTGAMIAVLALAWFVLSLMVFIL
jgi:hypothetical protein